MNLSDEKRLHLENKDKRKAWGIALGVHLVLFALMYLMAAYVITVPPPGDMSVEVAMADYGFDVTAGGDTESEVPSEEVQEVEDKQTSQTSRPVETSETRPIETQESSSVSTSAGSGKKDDKEKEKEREASNKLKEILNEINQSGGGGSDGSDRGAGNQGNPDGSIEGKGVFGGRDGNGWELSGRSMLGDPKLNEKPTEEGKVVLRIYVDKNGKVTNAVRLIEESNTASSYLFNLAQKAALSAKFNVAPDAPASQSGKMTFNFKLR